MIRYVALLHSIVLGPGRRVVMSDLRAMAEKLGFREARTLVATGNLIFATDLASPHEVEDRLEAAFAKTFGKPVDIIVRDEAAFRQLAAGNPFPDGKASNVVVSVMRTPLAPGTDVVLERYRSREERLCLVDGDLWIDFGDKPSQSRLLSALTTKRLGVGTLRNWNTVRGLVEMLG